MSEIKLPTDIKRLNYFTSQFLVAQDFIDEQSYHKEMRRLHNRHLHTWGIVEGLQVTSVPPPPEPWDQLIISPGLAIDRAGREIVVAAEKPLVIGDREKQYLSSSRDSLLVVCAAYKKQDCDPSSGNLNFKTRWKEEAEIIILNRHPSDDELGYKIPLAEVSSHDTVDLRRYVGLNPNTELTARTLTVTDYTELKGSLLVEGDAIFKQNVRFLSFNEIGEDEWVNLEVLKISSESGEFGIHMDANREFGFFSTGPEVLFAVKGGSGDAWLKGSLTVQDDVTLKNKLSFGKQYGASLVFYDMGNDGTSLAAGVQENTLYHRSSANFSWYTGGTHSGDKALDPGGGTRVMSLTTGEVTLGTARNEVKIGSGLTVEVDATFKKNLKVESFTTNDQREWDKVIWLKGESWDEQLLKYDSNTGAFRRAGFGISMHSSREFGILSSGPVVLFSVEGGTGNAWLKGSLTIQGGATIKQEGWQSAKLQSGWVDLGANAPDWAGYFKDSLGIVHLKGRVRSPSPLSPSPLDPHIFRFDPDYAPLHEELHIVCIKHAGGRADFGHLAINQRGVHLRVPQESDCEVFLDGVTFRPK